MLLPLAFGNAINALQEYDNSSTTAAWIAIWKIIAILMGAYVIEIYLAYSKVHSLAVIESRLRKKIWGQFSEIPLLRLYKDAPGVWVQKICTDTSLVCSSLVSVSFAVVGFAAFLALSLFAVADKAGFVAVILLISGSLAYAIQKMFRRQITQCAGRMRKASYRFSSNAYEFAIMQPLLRMFGASPIFAAKFDENSDSLASCRCANESTAITFNAILQFCMVASRVAILSVCTWCFFQARMSLGEVIAYDLLANQLITAVSGIMQIAPQLHQGMEAMNAMESFYNYCSDNKHRHRPQTGLRVVFDDVKFRYNDEARYIVNGFSATINYGERVCFVGKNGVGKTTLVNLILGLCEPAKGTVGAFSGRIAVVPQKITVFSGSLLENIRLYDESISREAVCNALRQCSLTDFVASLPEGVESEISVERMSGGELQRIGIARALVRQPELLITDEISNNLDVVEKLKTERILAELKGVCTVISITHDLSSIYDTDRVFVFHDGQIEEINGDGKEIYAQTYALLTQNPKENKQ